MYMSSHVMHLPTELHSREAKFNHLQDALSEIPSDESNVMLGDFNHVWSGSREYVLECVRGPHGVGELSKAGE